MSDVTVGGQAIIEGVMYRKGKMLSLAVQHPDKGIVVKKRRIKSLLHGHPKLNIPFIRGIILLFETLIIGVKALHDSANMAAAKKEEKLSTKELLFSLAISIVFALLIFKFIPLLLANLANTAGTLSTVQFNLLEGGVKFLLLVLYLFVIGRLQDVKRLFQYHGAEHKVINVYEAKRKLTLSNVLKAPTYHPRCGTSFIVFVLLISILFYVFIPLSFSFLGKLATRILLLPVIAGAGYEIIRLSGKFADHRFFSIIGIPGKWVQKLTTREPTRKQVRVALRSLQALL